LRGNVYFHSKFGFHDGGEGKKLIILLNSPSSADPYLFVKTTSERKNKPYTVGCIHSHKVFFVRCDGKHCFRLDTWVQLHDLYEFEPASIVKDAWARDLKIIGKIEYVLVNQIVNCLIRCNGDNITAYQKKLLVTQKLQ
jgi:hypothetical protein